MTNRTSKSAKIVRNNSREYLYSLFGNMSPEEYDAIRQRAARAFGIRPDTIDRKYKTVRKELAESLPLAQSSSERHGNSDRGEGGEEWPSIISGLGQRIPDVSDSAWIEFQKCAESMVGYRQAWLQVQACGWPSILESQFGRAYREAGENQMHLWKLWGWPYDSDMLPFWDESHIFISLGTGRYMDMVTFKIPDKINKIVPALTSVYLLKSKGSWTPTGRQRNCDMLSGPVVRLEALAYSSTPESCRKIVPSAGTNFRSWVQLTEAVGYRLEAVGQEGDKMGGKMGTATFSGGKGPKTSSPHLPGGPFLVKSGQNPGRWPVKICHHRASGPASRYIAPDDETVYDSGAWNAIDWNSLQTTPWRLVDDEAFIKNLRDRAFADISGLEKSFPGISRKALTAVISSMICRRMSGGAQDLLWLLGMTGSAKTATILLGTALCGDIAQTASLDSEEKDFKQEVGYAAEAGLLSLLLDEAQKAFDDRKKQRAVAVFLLKMNETIQTMLKFRGKDEFDLDCAIFLTGTAIPEYVLRMPELCRRMRSVRLPADAAQSKSWFETTATETSGGGIRGWRGRDPENAIVGDCVVSRIFDFNRACGFNLRLVDEYLGVQSLSSERSPATQERIHWLRVLYWVWYNTTQKLDDGKYDDYYADIAWLQSSPNFSTKKRYLDLVNPGLNERHPLILNMIDREIIDLEGMTSNLKGRELLRWSWYLSTIASASPWEMYTQIKHIGATYFKSGAQVGWKFGIFSDERHDWQNDQYEISKIRPWPKDIHKAFTERERDRRKAWYDDRGETDLMEVT